MRLKHRYLLINFLFPEPSELRTNVPNVDSQQVPDIVQFHRPTLDDITPQLLLRSIKDHISLLYGDYGVGVTSGSLNGDFHPANHARFHII